MTTRMGTRKRERKRGLRWKRGEERKKSKVKYKGRGGGGGGIKHEVGAQERQEWQVWERGGGGL